jgi:lipoprotein-anchoring transpeptidase ErfK/SrfK
MAVHFLVFIFPKPSNLASMIPSRRMSRLPLLLLALCLPAAARAQAQPAPPVRPEDTPALPEETEPAAIPPEAGPAAADAPAAPDFAPRPVADWLEGQVELSRRGFSCGSIDGVRGLQSAAALRAFQRNEGLRETGDLDQATKVALPLTAPALTRHVFSQEELAELQPVADTWLGKSEQTALAYATALELVAEHCHASPKFLVKLNPEVDWDAIAPGMAVQVPAVGLFTPAAKAAQLQVRLAEHVLEATDGAGRIIAHFPVSIARNVEKRPVGELHVTVIIPNPNYTFDPEVFPESEEAKELGRKLIIPPGPNNPVGLAWIGLDRTGYGIHGTPDPEKVGRTESHGCFRLANWDAQALLQLVTVGLPVIVEP